MSDERKRTADWRRGFRHGLVGSSIDKRDKSDEYVRGYRAGQARRQAGAKD